jgi:hypothetical protein
MYVYIYIYSCPLILIFSSHTHTHTHTHIHTQTVEGVIGEGDGGKDPQIIHFSQIAAFEEQPVRTSHTHTHTHTHTRTYIPVLMNGVLVCMCGCWKETLT